MKGLLLAVIGVCLLGCGGGGGGGASTPSPFVGHFEGPWSSTSGQIGTADVTCSSSGKITGAMVNTSAGLAGSVTARIDAGGHVDGSSKYPGYNSDSFAGDLVLSGNGQTLSGAIYFAHSGTTTTFNLSRQN